MWFRSAIDSLHSRSASKRLRQASPQTARSRFAARGIRIEPLEDRRMLSFSPTADYPVGTSPVAMVSADFNSDGRLDLATVNSSSNNVSVRLGNADGTFQAAQNSATGAGPLSSSYREPKTREQPLTCGANSVIKEALRRQFNG